LRRWASSCSANSIAKRRSASAAAFKRAYDHFTSEDGDFVVALPADTFRIYEYSDVGDLRLIDVGASAATAARARFDLAVFSGLSSGSELATRFAQARTGAQHGGWSEVDAPQALANTGDSIGSLLVALRDGARLGFVAARPWFGGIVTCSAWVASDALDAAAILSAQRAAWVWLRRAS